jgi:uridine kinase
MDILVIGIAGGTGSGKTTLTNRLKERFGKDISVIRHDDYYRSQDDISFEERVKTNYDHPDSFETDLLIEHLKQLKNGHSIECPVYSFSEHTRTKETRKIDPTKVIIVEGILIFQNPELLNMLDIRIFVDTDPDVRILRRILRDVKERGRSLDSVVTQYLSTVKPMHEQFVEPSKRNADIIVLEGGYNLVALDMIIQRIQGHVEATDE